MKIDLIILAGGPGKRISLFTKKTPKPLIKFNNKIFLETLIRHFAKYDFNNIYILAGYKGKKIFEKFNNKTFNFTKVKCLIEKKRKGTWGAVLKNKKYIKNNFFLINADSLIDENFHNFFFQKNNSLINMTLVQNRSYKSNSKLNSLSLNRGKVVYSKNSKYMNGGVYFINKKLLQKNNYKNARSIETEVIPDLIDKKKVSGFKSDNFFLDIGTYKNLNFGKNKLHSKLKKRAIFLDRDGVINYDKGYTYKWNNFKFKKNVQKGLKFLIKNNFLIFIVTNQAGIGKGYYTEKNFQNLHKKIKSYLAIKGIYINDVKYCPYHPEAKFKKYRKKSLYRKPGNLMIKSILREWDIDIKKSIMIGDKNSDKQAAKNSNLYFEFVKKDFYLQVKKFVKGN